MFVFEYIFLNARAAGSGRAAGSCTASSRGWRMKQPARRVTRVGAGLRTDKSTWYYIAAWTLHQHVARRRKRTRVGGIATAY